MSQALDQLRIAGFPGRYLQGAGALAAIGTVARELVALAAGEPGQRDVASLALRLLYLEHRRRGPGA